MSDGEYGTADNMIQQILDIETRTEYPEFDTDMKHIREAHTIVRCFLGSEDCERGAIVKNNNGQFAKIKVVGIGGAGGNAVARMIQAGLGNVEFVVMNTDAQVLEKMQSDDKLQLGATLTKGLGAGADPQVGRKAAEEDKQEIARVLEGADMVVLPGGMPGSTNLDKSAALEKAIESRVSQKKWMAAICAAPFILGKRGYLKGKEAICYPGFEKELIGAIIKNEKVVISDNFITSKGPGTALDFALAIVSVLRDKNTADELRAGMQAV